MKNQKSQKLLSALEAIELIEKEFGVSYSRSSMYRLLDEGKLKGRKIVGKRRIYLQSIYDFFCPNIDERPKRFGISAA